MKEATNFHHIIPRSRGGGAEDNLVALPTGFHTAWHQLFVNMTVEEVHAFIDAVMIPGASWTSSELKSLRGRIMKQSRKHGG